MPSMLSSPTSSSPHRDHRVLTREVYRLRDRLVDDVVRGRTFRHAAGKRRAPMPQRFVKRRRGGAERPLSQPHITSVCQS